VIFHCIFFFKSEKLQMNREEIEPRLKLIIVVAKSVLNLYFLLMRRCSTANKLHSAFLCARHSLQSKGMRKIHGECLPALQAAALKATAGKRRRFFPTSDVRDNYRFARILDKQDCRSLKSLFFVRASAGTFQEIAREPSGRRKWGKSRSERVINKTRLTSLSLEAVFVGVR